MRQVAVVGAGRMGRGIALAFALSGIASVVVDIKQRDAVDEQRLRDVFWSEVDGDLVALRDLGLLPPGPLEDVRGCIDLWSARQVSTEAQAYSVVFEAVPEIMSAKIDALDWIGNNVTDATPVASTTSSFLVTELAMHVRCSERFLNAHWLNPGHVMPLVELSAHEGTSDAVLFDVRGILEGIGKIPVTCAATPGYIVPRLQTLLMNEAARMVEEGVATAEDIDKATRFGLGLRFAALGVVEFIDFGGNDILYHASRYMQQATGSDRFASPPIVGSMMESRKNGLKDGEGFFSYAGVDMEAYRCDVLRRVCAMRSHLEAGLKPKTN